MRPAPTSPTIAATRSLGLLLVVVLAGCAALAASGSAGASGVRDARSDVAARWTFGAWHGAVGSSHEGGVAASGAVSLPVNDVLRKAGRCRDGDRRDRCGFGAEASAAALSRRLNLPPPARA